MVNHGIVTEGRSRNVPCRRGWRFDDEKYEADKAARIAAQERKWLVEMDAISERAGVCYFIGCTEGLVKIGFSKNVHKRLASLRSSSPFRLTLLATINGGRTRERYYHQRFASHSIGDEWFARAPEIEAEIARLNQPRIDLGGVGL